MTDEHFPVVGVGVVVLNDQDEVLLIQRGTEPNTGMWTIPGGRQEPGETLAETAHREIEEETAVTIGAPILIDVVDLIRHDDDGSLLRHYALIDYAAHYIKGTPSAGGDAAAVAWISLNDIETYISWAETLRIIRQAADLLAQAD